MWTVRNRNNGYGGKRQWTKRLLIFCFTKRGTMWIVPQFRILLVQFLHSDSNPDGLRGKHMGPLSWFLGIAVDQAGDYSTSASQTKYIEKITDKFVPSHETNSIKHSMPHDVNTFSKLKGASDDVERAKVANLPYMQIIGSLLYVCMTRPDIAYQMSILCKFMSNPSLACYDAAVALLLYVHTTRHMKLHFDGNVSAPSGLSDDETRQCIESNMGFVAYSDSSWHKSNGAQPCVIRPEDKLIKFLMCLCALCFLLPPNPPQRKMDLPFAFIAYDCRSKFVSSFRPCDFWLAVICLDNWSARLREAVVTHRLRLMETILGV